MRSRTWQVVRPALFEASFVVLGVVLALAAYDSTLTAVADAPGRP